MARSVQKCWLLHDWLYASKSAIPMKALDGKSTLRIVFAIVDEKIERSALLDNCFMYDTKEEADEMLQEMISY